METQSGRGRASRRARRGEEDAERDAIVIRFPRIDSEAWNRFMDMLPGRALLRVLNDPPEEFFAHHRNARRERLLALRSLLDALIEEGEPGPGRHSPAREVQID
jgi:hypothetical protein